ncbi:AbrB/MazE/SpoVT family DNA-binding domain-containing protein [Shewanella frigidimarina]|uniref:Transcriptional regulator/antitoxin, MazE n=1 Tax=Shewanella frigidimarina (strain NCIMB 400) TaxID=318167 RepID=Q07VX8_SHEFN|nr:AbrB/MazE/SpoVT family DNA-binding domain-containing protein [Shewanella frigidimarina]ABI73836.1 transcriptional regulator/antitoxin, MazE [Shewanella frigidimarina NCIMB 400]
MVTSKLLKIGDAVMLTIPSTILEELNLNVGATVRLTIDNGQLILSPKPKYSLEELIAKCDASAPISPEVQEWLDAPAVGKELF